MYFKVIAHQPVGNGRGCPHSPGYTTTYGRTPANERRRIKCTACSKAIMYRANCLDNVEVPNQNEQVVDIGKAGMGIHADYPEKPALQSDLAWSKTGSIIRLV